MAELMPALIVMVVVNHRSIYQEALHAPAVVWCVPTTGWEHPRPARGAI